MLKPMKHPAFDRTCAVMPAILRACLKRPRSYDYLQGKTGATRGSLHVLCARLRVRGLLRPLSPGTTSVLFQTTPKGARPFRVVSPPARRRPN